MHIPFDPAICFLDFKAIIPPMHKDTHMKMFFVMLVKRVRISKDFFFQWKGMGGDFFFQVLKYIMKLKLGKEYVIDGGLDSCTKTIHK